MAKLKTPVETTAVTPATKPVRTVKSAYPVPDAIRVGVVGAPAITPKPGGTVAAMHFLRHMGFEHFEIAWVQSVRISDEGCAAIRAAKEQLQLSLSVHAPFFINLNSQTADLMAKSDERLLAAARRGYLAGATEIVFHPGSYHSQPPEQVYERVKQKLLELTGILREEGVQVNLRPETMGKSAMFGTLEECVQLSADVPGVLPAIDFAHLHARTGQLNSYNEFMTMLKMVDAGIGRRGLDNLHIHLSGINYGPKGEKNHLPLNEADMRYRELLQALVDMDCHGSLAGEAPDPFHLADALTFQATFRRLRDLKAGKTDVLDDAVESDSDIDTENDRSAQG